MSTQTGVDTAALRNLYTQWRELAELGGIADGNRAVLAILDDVPALLDAAEAVERLRALVVRYRAGQFTEVNIERLLDVIDDPNSLMSNQERAALADAEG